MGGSRKTQTVGWKYPYDLHFGLAYAIDSLLEFRAGDAAAWQGRASTNATIRINAPNLWGGDDPPGEGGIVGDMDLMLGNEDQEPNLYLQEVFDQHSALRGKVSVLLKNTIYGSYNPYPKSPAFKVERFRAGWPDNEVWYPERIAVPLEMVPTAICIALDRSGSMADMTDNGRTRMENAKTAIAGVLDYIDGRLGNAVPIDIHGVAWAGDTQSITRREIGNGDITAVKHWFNGLNPTGTQTDFLYATQSSAAFFAGAPAIARRVFIFITDGEPSRAGYPFPLNEEDAAAVCQEAADELFKTPGVQAFGFNIDLPDTTWTKFLDNSPGDGVPVIDGADPDALQSAVAGVIGGLQGMNAAHILYYSKVSPTMEGLPSALLDDAHWRAQADRLYGEAFGLCTEWVPGSETVEAFQQRICDAIGGYLVKSRRDGKWRLNLARGAGSIENLPVLSDDDILEWHEEPAVLDDAVNALQTQWFDPVNKEEVMTPAEHALASIEAFGGVITETYVRNEIATFGLAARVNSRQLRARSLALRRISPTCNRKPAYWEEGTYFRVQCPKRGIANAIMLLLRSEVGNTASSAVKLLAVDDVHSLPLASFVEQEQPVDYNPPEIPLPVQHQRLIETPYTDLSATLSHAELNALPPETGYSLVVAARPGVGLNFTLMSGASGEELARNGSGDWCPTAVVPSGADSRLETVFEIAEGSRLDRVELGTPVLWDEEICRLDGIDLETNPQTVTLGRGCADTVADLHAAGSRLWFYGDWATSDGREYAEHEVVKARVLTRTSVGELPLASAEEMSAVMSMRHYRPYPPGGVKYNGDPDPDSDTPVVGGLVLTWAHRDRLLQADQLVDASESDIGPEPGVTYTVEYFTEDGLVLVDREEGIEGRESSLWIPPSGGSRYRVDLFAVRGGLESLQRHSRIMLFGGPASWTPNQIAPAFWVDDSSSVIDAGGGECQQWYDLSGNGVHLTQNTSAYRPIIVDGQLNGRRIIRFDGVNDGMINASSAGRRLFSGVGYGAQFCVYRKYGSVTNFPTVMATKAPVTGSPTRFTLLTGASSAGNHPRISCRRLDNESPTSLISPVDFGNDWVMVLIEMDWNVGAGRIVVDGAEVASDSSLTSAGVTSDTMGTDICLGNQVPGGGASNFPADVEIAAHLMFNQSLSQGDVDRLFGWAAWRFGLQSQLPLDHPYRDAPP